MTWELIVVCVILAVMLIALIVGGDKLDHWTFRGQEIRPQEPTIYGMTRRQIRRLRTFYINRTGDVKLERL